MGVKGLFSYINREKIKGAVKHHSIDDILRQIRKFREEHDKAPKLLFNLRAFNNYYDQNTSDVIFGCRFNKIKADFEELLSALVSAGAELIFTSKKSHLDKDEEIRCEQLNKDYENGMHFVHELENSESTRTLKEQLQKAKRMFPWQETSIIVLQQSAQKFGKFQENDCLTTVFVNGHVQIASDEDVYAIFGLDTSYLFHPGSWRFFFPSINLRSRQKDMIFKEYNKAAILNHFKFNYEQFQLFSALGGKFYSTVENAAILKNYFWASETRQDFEKIKKFVHKFAPLEKLPLQRATIMEILREIFPEPIEEDLIEHFVDALNFKPKLYENVHRFKDETVSLMLRNDPFSTYAECLINNLPIIDIYSPFLNASAIDMKPFKDLTIDWVKRVYGILSKDQKLEFKPSVIYRNASEEFERIEIDAEHPSNIPNLKKLVAGEASMDEKFKTLAFLIGNSISEANLKKIPLDYLMHIVLAVHLVKNDSMTITEAIAMTKAIRDNSSRGFTIYPHKVNVRAFRVSALYETMYSVLLMCLSPIGLKDFIVELTLDNVQFQNINNDLTDWSAFKNADKENAFELMMAIIINEE